MAKHIDLETFCGGAFSEAVNREMVRINQNIQDPNTDAEKARTLTVTIKFKPDEERRLVKAEIVAKASLVPSDSIKTTMVSGKDIKTGEVEMSEYGNEGQVRGQMAFDEHGRSFDPETGEIPMEQPRNIRDLRNSRAAL